MANTAYRRGILDCSGGAFVKVSDLPELDRIAENYLRSFVSSGRCGLQIQAEI
jgi:hypothetical protein